MSVAIIIIIIIIVCVSEMIMIKKTVINSLKMKKEMDIEVMEINDIIIKFMN